MNESKVIKRIEKFIRKRHYTYSVDYLLYVYTNHWKKGVCVIDTMVDCFKNLDNELEALLQLRTDTNSDTYFYSNCLIEAIKQWIKSPTRVSIRKRGSFKMIYRKKMFPHFYWVDKRTGRWYDFARDTKFKGFREQLWFKGYIREVKYAKLGLFNY